MLGDRRLLGLLAIVIVIAAVVLIATLGGDDEDEDDTTPAPQSVEVTAETTEEAAPAATEETAPVETEEAAEPEVTEEVAPVETEEVAAPEATEEAAVAPLAEGETLRITLVVNGVLGDKSFFDSAQRGMDQLVSEGYNVDINTIELGVTPENWESGLADAMAHTDDYDVLIVGTFQMPDFLGARVHEYPDKRFILFDAPVPYENPEICVEGCTNVYSVMYAQNEGSFLAGVFAGAMTIQTDIEGMNADPIIGAIGGQDSPVINDFIVGYKQGACLVNPESQVLIQYAGDWNDPATGKEIALAMYEQKADIAFQIAGQTGVGVFEAAQEQSQYAIGVDSDQATLIEETYPEQAQRILTSMLKNIDNSLVRAISMHLEGTLPYGQVETLGIAEGGVGLAYNDIYTENTPENIQNLIAAVEEAVTNGEISVVTAFGPEAVTTAITCEEMPAADFDVAQYLGE